MPGPFTHIYTARRVADFLKSADVTEEFIRKTDEKLGDPQKLLPELLARVGTKTCADVMSKWEKFTAVGAIGPDLFFWLQDYNVPWIPCDEVMLALSLVYYLDDEGFIDDPLDAILTVLAETVPDPWAKILRFLVKVHKLWLEFVKVWDATIGPIVEKAGEIIDDALGGLLTTLADAITQFKNGLITLAEAEFLTQGDVFSWFSLKMRQGFDEKAFLWSDMTHYRRTSVVPSVLIKKATAMMATDDTATEEHGAQLLAFALGWACHVGTDVIAHSFVNEQCGGPFRTHWQRHHLIENHMDAWNYECTRTGKLPADPFVAWQESYPSVADSALYFAVQIPQNIEDLAPGGDPAAKQGDLRQPLPKGSDSSAKTRRDSLLETEGALPSWLASIISETLIEVYADPKEGGNADLLNILNERVAPHPQNLEGSSFQDNLKNDPALISKWLGALGIDNIGLPLEDLRKTIAPDPSQSVPKGFPFPWEIKVAYRLMLSWFKRSYISSMNLDRPEEPSLPGIPPSDYDFGPPDFSGLDPSDDPVSNGCGAVAAMLDWIFKTFGKVASLLYDIAKNVASAITMQFMDGNKSQPEKLLIYYTITLPVWEATQQVRDILVHLGYFMPQAQQFYSKGGLKRPNEIDQSLVQLGHSVDSFFAQALADAGDIFGNLDNDPALISSGTRNVLGAANPWLPVRPPPGSHAPAINQAVFNDNVVEYLRPWAFPEKNNENNPKRAGNYIEGPKTTAGPYPTDTLPDQLFNINRLISNQARIKYQKAGCSKDTDKYNNAFVLHQDNSWGADSFDGSNPLGDPVVFSAYLIGQLTCGSQDFLRANFNLDADRGYGYLCWDWTRDPDSKVKPQDGRGNPYIPPKSWPEGSLADGRWTMDPAVPVGSSTRPNMHATNVDITYYGRPGGCNERGPEKPK